MTETPAIEQARTLVRGLVDEYADLRRANVMRGDTETQTDALAILAWDLGAFCSASSDLLAAGHWGPANALGRLIEERAEYLLAIHEDSNFAAQFWKRSESLAEEPDRLPRGRTGEARRFVRRVAQRRGGAESSDRLLQSLIEKHDLNSFMVHPNAVSAAWAFEADNDESGGDALAGC